MAQVYCSNNQTSNEYNLHITETDRYIMLAPDDWGEVLEYIRLLEKRIKNKSTKKELNKILNTSQRLVK